MLRTSLMISAFLTLSAASAQTLPLLQTQTFPKEYVNRVVFGPDSNTLAVGTRSVYLWQVGQTPTVLASNDRPVNALHFSPDGKTVASTDSENLLLVTLPSGSIQKTTEYQTNRVVRFSPDNQFVFSSASLTPRLLQLSSNKIQALPKKMQSDLLWPAFSPDSSTLAYATQEGNVVLVSLKDPNQQQILNQFNTTFTQVIYSPDGKTLALLAYNGVVWLYDTSSKTTTQLPRDPYVFKVLYHPAGKMLVYLSSNTLRFLDAKTGAEQAAFRFKDFNVTDFDLSMDGKRLAIGTTEGQVQVFDTSAWGAWDSKLKLDLNVKDAAVYINGTLRVPDQDSTYGVFSGVPQEVRVKSPNSSDFTSTQTLKAGQTKVLTATLKSQKGSLWFKTEPKGADVTINGEEKGKTPFKLSLGAGEVEYLLTLDDHFPVTQSIQVKPDETTEVNVKFKEIPGLFVRSVPAGAQVYLNGKLLCEVTPCLIRNLRPGETTYRIQLKGYADESGTVVVPEEGKEELKVDLQGL